MKKGYFFAFLFSVLLFIPKAHAAELAISTEEAQAVIEKFIAYSPNDEQWSNSETTSKQLFYDIDDSVLGYHFKFYNDDKYQGYIIISATKEPNPILQYSIGQMGYDLDQSSKDEKIYYLGATNYLTAKNKENLKNKL